MARTLAGIWHKRTRFNVNPFEIESRSRTRAAAVLACRGAAGVARMIEGHLRQVSKGVRLAGMPVARAVHVLDG